MLDVMEAFVVMRLYLDNYYSRTQSSDIGAMLSDTMILESGSTADPAAWEDWLTAVKKNIMLRNDSKMSERNAYQSTLEFLKGYGQRINSEEIERLVSDMDFMKDDNSHSAEYWNQWQMSIKEFHNGSII